MARIGSKEKGKRIGLGVAPAADLVWHDIRPFGVEGKGWAGTEHFYDRLPARARGVVRPPVWELGQNSAGLCVRFVTGAAEIHARWRLRFETLAMNHMPATGMSGLDLYVRLGGQWRWIGVGRPEKYPVSEFQLVSGVAPGRRQYLLYLPLYNGVDSVEIGLPRRAAVAKAPPRRGRSGRPICFYGTSITQGGCASRPGMAYPAILGRRLERPTINLGFSGNGQAEPEVARLLAELDPSVFVLDCLPNLTLAQVLERVGPMVRTIRAARVQTPIVLVENVRYQQAPCATEQRRNWTAKNAALRRVYRQLKAGGVKGLHYVPADDLFGHDGEATVDGAHATDLGFIRIANVLEPVLRPLSDDSRTLTHWNDSSCAV